MAGFNRQRFKLQDIRHVQSSAGAGERTPGRAPPTIISCKGCIRRLKEISQQFQAAAVCPLQVIQHDHRRAVERRCGAAARASAQRRVSPVPLRILFKLLPERGSSATASRSGCRSGGQLQLMEAGPNWKPHKRWTSRIEFFLRHFRRVCCLASQSAGTTAISTERTAPAKPVPGRALT